MLTEIINEVATGEVRALKHTSNNVVVQTTLQQKWHVTRIEWRDLPDQLVPAIVKDFGLKPTDFTIEFDPSVGMSPTSGKLTVSHGERLSALSDAESEEMKAAIGTRNYDLKKPKPFRTQHYRQS